MTLDEMKKNSMVAGMEGLGGYHWEFSEDKFADLLITEISKWCFWNSPADCSLEQLEGALREHLGMK